MRHITDDDGLWRFQEDLSLTSTTMRVKGHGKSLDFFVFEFKFCSECTLSPGLLDLYFLEYEVLCPFTICFTRVLRSSWRKTLEILIFDLAVCIEQL